MFTERDALVQQARQRDLLRDAEEERLARTIGRSARARQHSSAFRLGYILKTVGRRLQGARRHEAEDQSSPARAAAYER